MKRLLTLTALIICISLYFYVPAAEDTAPMNKYVMEVVKSFPTDGTYKYWWPRENVYDGATTDVYYCGVKVMRGDPQKRSFCCGLTLQVFYLALEKYMRERGVLPPSQLTPDKVKDFQFLWFCPEINSPGPAEALEKYGLGYRVMDLNEAQPGDFVQFWRNNNTGHSVIFINWVHDEQGNLTALHYWSTQKATGISYNTEPIGNEKSHIDRNRIFIGRLNSPDKWVVNKQPE